VSKIKAKELMNKYQHALPIRFVLLMSFFAAGFCSIALELLIGSSMLSNTAIDYLSKIQSWHIFVLMLLVHLLDPKMYKILRNKGSKGQADKL
jgi:hypothetical protein